MFKTLLYLLQTLMLVVDSVVFLYDIVTFSGNNQFFDSEQQCQ